MEWPMIQNRMVDGQSSNTINGIVSRRILPFEVFKFHCVYVCFVFGYNVISSYKITVVLSLLLTTIQVQHCVHLRIANILSLDDLLIDSSLRYSMD